MQISIGSPIVHRKCRGCGTEGEWAGRWLPCPACQEKAA